MSRAVGEGDVATTPHGGGVNANGFWASMKAVMWAFIGVRKGSDYRSDTDTLDPRAVVAAGVLGGLVFVLVVIALVGIVVRVAS